MGVIIAGSGVSGTAVARGVAARGEKVVLIGRVSLLAGRGLRGSAAGVA